MHRATRENEKIAKEAIPSIQIASRQIRVIASYARLRAALGARKTFSVKHGDPIR